MPVFWTGLGFFYPFTFETARPKDGWTGLWLTPCPEGKILPPSKCKISTNPSLQIIFCVFTFFFFIIIFFFFFPKTWNSSPKWKSYSPAFGGNNRRIDAPAAVVDILECILIMLCECGFLKFSTQFGWGILRGTNNWVGAWRQHSKHNPKSFSSPVKTGSKSKTANQSIKL